MRILSVGGGSDRTPPKHYEGAELVVLDIDPAVKPDICLDARLMGTMPAGEYGAVICSHALEHFHRHDVPAVLAGFLHVLTDEGVAEVIVPSILKAIEAMRRQNLDLTDVWYRTAAGTPIAFHDVLYGWNHAMAMGNLHYGHRSAFTARSLGEALLTAGFKGVQVWEDESSIYARAFKKEQACPSP